VESGAGCIHELCSQMFPHLDHEQDPSLAVAQGSEREAHGVDDHDPWAVRKRGEESATGRLVRSPLWSHLHGGSCQRTLVPQRVFVANMAGSSV
jgi:hypothetical protein